MDENTSFINHLTDHFFFNNYRGQILESLRVRQTWDMCASLDWMSFMGSLKKTFSWGFIWNRHGCRYKCQPGNKNSNLLWICRTRQPRQRWPGNCSWPHTRCTALRKNGRITRATSVGSLNVSAESMWGIVAEVEQQFRRRQSNSRSEMD